jgi:hypothetical protein
MTKNVGGVLIVALLISACAAPIAVDGAATANVFTWEDLNGNGKPDPEEPPLPYVTTSIVYPDFLTDVDGRAAVWEFKPGCAANCSDGESVRVKTPAGFLPTTSTQYPLIGNEGKYYFGFQASEESRGRLFPDEPDWQTAFSNRGAEVLSFHYLPNERLEITLDRGHTAVEPYYPRKFAEDEFYFDIFIFDIVLYLKKQDDTNIPEVRITLMPDNMTYTCRTADIDEWDGRISGDKILAEHCERASEQRIP